MAQALAQKYAEERNKRLRADGNAQYVDVRSQEVKDLAKDPWVDYESPAIKNPPLKDGSHIKFLILGAGHSGILFAYRLIEAGFSSKDIVIVDTAGGFGGTWYWNRYPGLMCDVEGFVYLPLLEETGYVPKHKYSYGAEIRGQSERIAKKWGLQGQFCTKVESQTWDEGRKQWIVKMTRTLGNVSQPEVFTVDADFVVLTGGILAIPKVPSLPGWDEFRAKNHAFHTSRWDYSYTGGSQEKPDMTKLKDKRVAIIGTGATAVQAVPELAKWAKHLYVVQRTPSYCGERGQKEVTPELWAGVADAPGWQRRRRLNFNSFVSNNPAPVDLVNDGWTHVPAACGTIGSNQKIVPPEKIPDYIEELQKLDSPETNRLRDRVSRVVKDPETAEKLKAWYGTWCKRPTFHDDYLPAFNRDNVTLIDTNGKGLEGYTANGITFNGVEYEVDCIVLATGFRTSGGNDDPPTRVDGTIIGRNGQSMADKWREPSTTTALGTFSNGFPNMSGTFYSAAGISYNLTSVFDIFAQLYAHIVREAHEQAKAGQKVVIDISQQAEEQWGLEVLKRSTSFAPLSICTPGYYTAEGQLGAKTSDTNDRLPSRHVFWGGGPLEYQDIIEAYIAKQTNKLEDFVVEVVAA
ncbi:hypothetical protein ACN47E_004423 [Coniothyrium glycines]